LQPDPLTPVRPCHFGSSRVAVAYPNGLTLWVLDHIRSFLIVREEGSLHRAAARLNLSQPALSRRIQALEDHLGGRLFDRSSTGVKLTSGGHALAQRMEPLLKDYDLRVSEVRGFVRGEDERLRIGYLPSAARQYLQPALNRFHRRQRNAVVKLVDLSPGEQISALRRGELDLAMTDQTGKLLARDFYVRKLAVVPSLVGLSPGHPLASRRKLTLAELKGEGFIAPSEDDLPGYARWLTRHCRERGQFRPRFVDRADNLPDSINRVAGSRSLVILPQYAENHTGGIRMIPLADPGVTWDLMLVWRRGKVAGPLRALLEEF